MKDTCHDLHDSKTTYYKGNTFKEMLNQPKKRAHFSGPLVKSKTTTGEQASSPLALDESSRALLESRDGTIFEHRENQGPISPSMNRHSTIVRPPVDV